jgi:hypothetical protein
LSPVASESEGLDNRYEIKQESTLITGVGGEGGDGSPYLGRLNRGGI